MPLVSVANFLDSVADKLNRFIYLFIYFRPVKDHCDLFYTVSQKSDVDSRLDYYLINSDGYVIVYLSFLSHIVKINVIHGRSQTGVPGLPG